MSDDDDDAEMAAVGVDLSRPVLRFGSLEEQARARQLHAQAESTSSPLFSATASSSDDGGLVITQAALTASLEKGRSIGPASSSPTSSVEVGQAAGHIHVSGEGAEHYELSDSARVEREKQAAMLKEMEVHTHTNLLCTSVIHAPQPLHPLCAAHPCLLPWPVWCCSAVVQLRKRARGMTIPTNDTLVRRRLRELGQPITVFAERQPGRRERLGHLLARLAMEDGAIPHDSAAAGQKDMNKEKEKTEVKAFLTQGPDALKAARTSIAEFSLQAAQSRLQRERESAATSTRYEPHPSLQSYSVVTSTVADQRPISSCAFSPSAQRLATSSWSGLCKVWAVPSCSEELVLQGHSFNATDVAWHPRAESSQSPASVNLASCGMDGQVLLWPLQASKADVDMLATAFPAPTPSSSSSSSSSPSPTPSTRPLASLTPHAERCSRVAFHPCGDYLYSTSHDRCYQLHDLHALTSIYSQPGHSYPVYSLSLHPDGSLLLTGDTGGIAHAWDTRMPRVALSLVGHARAVLCSAWSSGGWTVATGSEDNSVRLWDIRGKRCMYTLPAHSKLVSGCTWMRGEWEEGGRARVSECLVTCGYDGLVKVWDGHAMRLVREMRGHDRMAMRVSVGVGGEGSRWGHGEGHATPYIASCSYDRTFKLYHADPA